MGVADFEGFFTNVAKAPLARPVHDGSAVSPPKEGIEMAAVNHDRPMTRGAHHVGLTVPSLEDARRFFVEALGYETVGEIPHYPAASLSDGKIMITLWQAEDPENAVPFDRKRVIGLHHLSLAVEDDDALDALYRRLRERDDVSVEFEPEPLNGGPIRHMMCGIPGDVRVEFIAPRA